jgi:hypothetical protein
LELDVGLDVELGAELGVELLVEPVVELELGCFAIGFVRAGALGRGIAVSVTVSGFGSSLIPAEISSGLSAARMTSAD